MAELNSYEYATNDVLNKDPLRLLDLGNDVQLAVDKFTKNPNGEEKRANKNFQVLMDSGVYTPGETAFNVATNLAPDLATLYAGPIVSKIAYKFIPFVRKKAIGGAKYAFDTLKPSVRAARRSAKEVKKDVPKVKKAIDELVKKNITDADELVEPTYKVSSNIRNKFVRDEAADKQLFENIIEGSLDTPELRANKVIKKPLNEANAIVVKPKPEVVENLSNADYQRLLSVLDNTKEAQAYDYILGQIQGEYNKNPLGDIIKENLKQKQHTKDLVKGGFLSKIDGEQAEQLNRIETALKKGQIKEVPEQSIGDITNRTLETYNKNKDTIQKLFDEKRIDGDTKFKLDQQNKIYYTEARNPIIDKYISTLGEKQQREYRPIEELLEKKPNWVQKIILPAAKELGITTVKQLRKEWPKLLALAVPKAVDKYRTYIRDEMIVPGMADLFHLDLQNPSRFNKQDIKDTWDLLKMDWDNKEHPLPENPTPRQMISFINDWVPNDMRRKLYDKLKNRGLKNAYEYYKENYEPYENGEYISFNDFIDKISKDEKEEFERDSGRKFFY